MSIVKFLHSTPVVRVVVSIALSLYILIPLVAFAQGVSKQIVPCAGALPDPSRNLPACTTCHIAELAQNLINTAILLIVFFAAVVFAYAGFQYLTASTFGDKGYAKKLLTNVTIGLIIVLSAWMVVDIIMKTFLGDGSGGLGPWNDICRSFPQIS